MFSFILYIYIIYNIYIYNIIYIYKYINIYIIIFDEIDSICRARGSTGLFSFIFILIIIYIYIYFIFLKFPLISNAPFLGGGTGVQDTVVNQLLSKIDGVQVCFKNISSLPSLSPLSYFPPFLTLVLFLSFFLSFFFFTEFE